MHELKFQVDGYNFKALLPVEMGSFMGKEIAVQIYKQPRERNPSKLWMGVLDVILGDLQSIIRKTEESLKEYEGEHPESLAHIVNPYINIGWDNKKPDEWSFVVERDDWDSFGWHIEFKGSSFIEIWAGD